MGGRPLKEVLSQVTANTPIPRLVRAATGSSKDDEVSPLQAAFQAREQMLAMKVLENSTGEVEDDLDTRRVEAEAKKLVAEATKLEASARLMELRAQMPQANAGADKMTEMIMLMMGQLSEDNKALRETQANQQQEIIANIVGTFREGLAELRKDMISTAGEKGSAASGFVDRVNEVKQLNDILRPLFYQVPQAAAGADHDLDTTILMHRLQSEHEIRMAELTQRQEDAKWTREMDLRKMLNEERRSEGMMNMLKEAAPALNALAAQAIQKTTGVEVTPAAPATAPAPNGDGSFTMTCPMESCGAQINVSEGETEVTCPGCGQRLGVRE